MRKKEDLIKICTEICLYAQEHSSDEEAWGPRNSDDLDNWMQHTSFTVACFIANNTRYGSGGVEWDIVQQELVGEIKTEAQWRKIISRIVEEYR